MPFTRKRWSWDYSSRKAYSSSIEKNRDRFRLRIGVVEERLPVEDLKLVSTLTSGPLVAESRLFRVLEVFLREGMPKDCCWSPPEWQRPR